jgi:MFS family permease
VSTIEYSAFLLPVLAGRLSDSFGVRAGFALSAVVAVVTLLLIVTVEGRYRSRPLPPPRGLRRSGSGALPTHQASKERAI